MNAKNESIGALLLFTSGEYSDFYVDGLYRVIVEYDHNAQVSMYRALPKGEFWWQRKFKRGYVIDFQGFLLESGLLEQVEYNLEDSEGELHG